jgi:hypothetical protein
MAMSIWGSTKRGEGFQLARDTNIMWYIEFISMIGRFFLGRPMLGDEYRKTDASFWHRGNNPLHPKARKPGRWSYLSEGTRALIRVGILFILIAIVWGSAPGGFWGGGFWDGGFFHLSIHNTFSSTALALIILTFWTAIVKTDTAIRDLRHKRGLIKPMQARVASMFGVDSREVKVKIPRRNVRPTEEEAA